MREIRIPVLGQLVCPRGDQLLQVTNAFHHAVQRGKHVIVHDLHIVWDVIVNADAVIAGSQRTAGLFLVFGATAFTPSTSVTVKASSPPVDGSVVEWREGAVVGEHCWERARLVSVWDFEDRVDVEISLVVQLALCDLFLLVFLFGQAGMFAVASYPGDGAWRADGAAGFGRTAA